MTKVIFLSFLLNMAVAGKVAMAQPMVDERVKEFLAEEIRQSETLLPVFVKFIDDHLRGLGVDSGENPSQVIRQMQAVNGIEIERLVAIAPWAQSIELEPSWITNGLFTQLTADQISTLLQSKRIFGIYWSRKKVVLRKLADDQALAAPDRFTYGLEKVGVPQLRRTAPDLLGTGVRVGILDTGIADKHPDLRGRLVQFKNFSPAAESEPRDDFGHGTHVAGTVAGGSSTGLAIGVAPRIDLIVGRIFDGNGESDTESILQAMQWMADPDGNSETNDFAQVVNNSWSDDEPYNTTNPEDNPFCQAVDGWVRIGIIPVFSAGNTGPSESTIGLPGGCPSAISVGATEQNDRSPHFSSTGPAIWRNMELIKPEISAPGFEIKSAERFGGLETMSGTSMSAPHVTGAFAILLQAFPLASVQQIKNALLLGAKDLGRPGQDNIFGYGRVDLVKSLEILKGN